MLRIHHIVSFVRVRRKCALDLSFSYSHHRIVRNVLVRRIASIVNVSWTFLFLCIGLDWTSWISLFLIRRVVRLHRKCVWDLSFLSHRNVLIHRIRRGTFLFLAIATFLSFVSVVSFAFVVLIHRPSYVVRFRRKCVWDLCFLFLRKALIHRIVHRVSFARCSVHIASLLFWLWWLHENTFL
jgi:hypothetical protein